MTYTVTSGALNSAPTNHLYDIHTHIQTQLFNGPLSGTSWVGQYHKKHPPTKPLLYDINVK